MATRKLLPILLLTLAARAGPAGSLAELLPAETPLFVEFRAPTADEMTRLAYRRSLAEPALQEVLRRTREQGASFTSMAIPLGAAARLRVDSDLSASEAFVHVEYQDAKGVRRFAIRSPLAVAVAGRAEGPIPVDAVVAFAVDGDASEALATIRRAVAAKLLDLEGDAFGDVDRKADAFFGAAEHEGVRYMRAEAGPITLFAGAVGPFVAVTTTEARMKDLIERGRGGRADSLAADPRHRAALDLVGPGTRTSVMSLHVDRALAAFAPLAPQVAAPIQAALGFLGLDALRSVALVSAVDGAGVTSTTSLLFEGERRGLARLLAEPGGPATCSALAFAPENSLYVTCGRFDLRSIWRDIAAAGNLPGIAEVWFRRVTGMSLRDDFVALLGPEVGLVVATNHGFIPDVGLVVDVRDPERLRAALEKLFAALPLPNGVTMRRARLGDVTVHVLPLGDPRLGGVPVSPTVGLVDGKLVVAPYPLSFQRLLAVKRGAKPSIEANEDFRALRRHVPAGTLGISYLDLRRLVATYYDTMMPIAQSMPQEPGGGGIFELPEVEDITRHLFGRVGWRVVDASGVHWKAHSATDGNAVLFGALVAGAIFGWVAQEGLESARAPVSGVASGARDREAAACVERVSRIRLALLRHKREHGTLPQSLDALRAGRLTVPGSEARYLYLGPGGEGKVLLHGFPNGADGRVTVLLASMEVVRCTPEELEALKKP